MKRLVKLALVGIVIIGATIGVLNLFDAISLPTKIPELIMVATMISYLLFTYLQHRESKQV
jgi:hypothetical protein